MKAFFNYLSWIFFARPLKQQLRTRSLQSLRVYIKAVSGARKGSMMAVAGIMGLSSITVGFFLLIGGLLWLANLNPAAYPWIMVGVGALLTTAGIAGFIFAFRQKLWVDLSRINDLTQAAIEKFPANERQTNPAVTAAWSLATNARIREHSKLERERESLAAAMENPYVAAHGAGPSYVAEPAATVRPTPRMEPMFQPV